MRQMTQIPSDQKSSNESFESLFLVDSSKASSEEFDPGSD
jgi:hypothetical protein